jgi:hypothetical protein
MYRRSLEIGSSLCRGPIGKHGVGLHLPGTLILGAWKGHHLPGTLKDEGGLRKWSVTLYGSSVRGTCREGSFNPLAYTAVSETAGVARSVNLYELCVLYIGQAHRYPPNSPFYIFFQQIYILNFLNMLHTIQFFSSKCCLFHNATFFGSCIIHILHTGCAKI